MKVGRNDLCPCGSGKKFKKCHLAMPSIPVIGETNSTAPPIPPQVWQKFEGQRREEQARVAAFGEIRPIIHIPDYAGYRMVVVRNRLYYSKKWNSFTDFLFEYGVTPFGREWLETQKSAPEADQHPVYIWRKQAYAYMEKQKPQPDGTFSAVPNGPMAACNNFYYDLYTVDDNSLLDDDLLNRLRHRDQFQGALHELFAEATCLRAGFTIIRENEKDRNRRHVEFVAVHKATGQHVLVEAKSRHRAGVMGQPGTRKDTPDIRFHRLINAAVAKDSNNPLAIFVDTNLPPDRAYRFYTPRSRSPIIPSLAMTTLMDKVRRDYGGVDPYNILIFSNHPQHYSEDDRIAPGSHWAGSISQEARVPVYHQQALLDLFKAVNVYGNVPTHFPADRDQPG
jgi:hypothetical protein